MSREGPADRERQILKTKRRGEREREPLIYVLSSLMETFTELNYEFCKNYEFTFVGEQ